MEIIQALAPFGPLFVALICFCAVMGFIGGFFAFIVKFMQKPLEKDISLIKETLNNHITDLKADIKDLNSKIDNLINTLLKKQ